MMTESTRRQHMCRDIVLSCRLEANTISRNIVVYNQEMVNLSYKLFYSTSSSAIFLEYLYPEDFYTNSPGLNQIQVSLL